ncbi:MAG: Rpn family recombination-promoting nuclease/putative transposase [Chitinispirillales bacterium]|jgi:hypothetical protein|nr:Rpn family recombination-promoting nuclease/putative transposase [Chitinispirillales bacterium]
MLIANPLYDTAFKGLAQDLEVAKAIIEALLETEVLDIELGATEFVKPVEDDDKRPKFFRMDYSAVIKTEDGSRQRILIEMQKANGGDALARFREYVAQAGYRAKSDMKGPLPFVTIYFLGFKLKNVATPCLKVSRQYVDMLSNEVLDTKEKFVELLTHDSFIIQAPRIKTSANPQTRLEKILSVFEQDGFTDSSEETIYYTRPVEDPYHKKMLDILHYIGTNPEERKKMDNEAYWLRYEDMWYGEMARMQDRVEEAEEMAEKRVAKATAEAKAKAKAEAKAEVEAAKAEAKAEAEAAKAKVEAAKAEAEKRDEAIVRQLLNKGLEPNEISTLMNIPAKTVKRLAGGAL